MTPSLEAYVMLSAALFVVGCGPAPAPAPAPQPGPPVAEAEGPPAEVVVNAAPPAEQVEIVPAAGVEILGADAIDEAAANEIIMAARAHWFEGEGGEGESGGEAGGAAGSDRTSTVQVPPGAPADTARRPPFVPASPPERSAHSAA